MLLSDRFVSLSSSCCLTFGVSTNIFKYYQILSNISTQFSTSIDRDRFACDETHARMQEHSRTCDTGARRHVCITYIHLQNSVAVATPWRARGTEKLIVFWENWTERFTRGARVRQPAPSCDDRFNLIDVDSTVS